MSTRTIKNYSALASKWSADGEVVVCPYCAGEYVSSGTPHEIDGKDDYRAGWGGRGSLLSIPFHGECGSEWDLCFGFHKGLTLAFIRVRAACEEHLGDYLMPFGRHAGRSLEAIAETDLGYLRWAANNMNQPRLRAAIQLYLDRHGATSPRINDPAVEQVSERINP